MIHFNLSLEVIEEGAFREHVFYSDTGARLATTAGNLAGWPFEGDDTYHMIRDTNPQGDDDNKNSEGARIALYCSIGFILAVSFFLLIRRH